MLEFLLRYACLLQIDGFVVVPLERRCARPRGSLKIATKDTLPSALSIQLVVVVETYCVADSLGKALWSLQVF